MNLKIFMNSLLFKVIEDITKMSLNVNSISKNDFI